MSSHREAPAISQDPVADNADTYAFVSPDDPTTVTIITNYVPLENPPGGPNFFEFGDDVLYSIYIDNDGDARPDITYQFSFHTEIRNPNTFLYNTGPITSLDSPNWNRRQFYDVTKFNGSFGRASSAIGTHLASPPCNIGPRSTPNYAALAQAAVQPLPTGETVFAGQRNDGFFVDLGAVFDLADLRPFQNLHLIPSPAAPGVDDVKGYNVHSIAIQIPKSHLTRDGSTPSDPADARAVIGVYASASRRRAGVHGDGREADWDTGPWVQVSRLGNPLVNEVLIPLGQKDLWNQLDPPQDKRSLPRYEHPELAKLIPVLYPGVSPHLAGLTAARADLVAILLTGLPSGIVPGFQNFTGKTPADLLRLNMAIPPSAHPNILGILGGDLAGFPNGRRVFDDVVTIELRAVAGVTFPLIDPSFTPDGAASLVTDGAPSADPDAPYLKTFPYLGVPNEGFEHRHDPA